LKRYEILNNIWKEKFTITIIQKKKYCR
jgi:hypothetical protein